MSRSCRTRLALLPLLPLLAGLVAAAPASAGLSPELRCVERKLEATAKYAEEVLGCRATAIESASPVATSCVDAAEASLRDDVQHAEDAGGCSVLGDVDTLLRHADYLVDRAAAALVQDPASASECAARKLEAGGRRVEKAAKAHGDGLGSLQSAHSKKKSKGAKRSRRSGGKNKKNKAPKQAKKRKKAAGDRLVEDFERLDDRFRRSFAEAETESDCQTLGDVDVAAGLFDAGLDAIYAAAGLVGSETRSIPSGARPAGTPGSPGVDANLYPNLVTQFGGTGFDLNRATFTRFFVAPDGVQPEAILVLVPGFEGGGASFKILAENLVTRARENGLRIETWAYDRRGNQLEDREGLALALAANDADIGLDWYFGAELGLPLHPALAAGPGRRAFFHGTYAETAFIANWTNLVFSRDIDAVVDAARAEARGQNVFLGGHSAGTGFTARYAATDLNLSGAGAAQPAFAKLRGLVLLEGGGGSTAAPPLSDDELDRIEDRADGGLFFAVRDDAPRCTDGSPCSLASEAVDCAGHGHATCTEPTFAYAVVAGLLNPRILASSEPGAVQGLTDRDTGQVILQVDQGAPGNTAISAVPDLGALAILPSATAEGALGSFLDDDGFISSFAVFVRTSVGAPGPVVAGLQTWQDLAEAPLPASALPDNGPAPTALPTSEWGQEKEVTRIDRVAETFFFPESNFTDWYYPSGGLSTTTGLGLDSSQLSVGRARPDIENLTQAPAVDIPVICFGGTNGLTETPSSFLGFAASIGSCATPSCAGAPRVVDASLPNPAFPTFGGIAGGFEVHLSEGYAHVDIVTGEDDADNQVTAPLIEFLRRNLQ